MKSGLHQITLLETALSSEGHPALRRDGAAAVQGCWWRTTGG
jgi:hypothetical protein